MAIIGRFLDKLADIAEEREEFRRSGGEYRLAGRETRTTRFSAPRAFGKRQQTTDDIGDLARYEGVYKEEKPQMPSAPQQYPSFYTGEERAGYHFTEVRSAADRPGGDPRYDSYEGREQEESPRYSRRGNARDEYGDRPTRGRHSDRPEVKRGHVFDDIESEEAGAFYEAEYERYMRTAKQPPKKRRVGRKMTILVAVTFAVLAQIIIFSSLTGEHDRTITSAEENPEVVYSNTVTSDGEEIPTTVDGLLRLEAENIVMNMTLEQKVGQMLLVRSNGKNTKDFCELIKSCHAGGVLLFKDNFKSRTKAEVTSYINSLQEAGGGSMLVCVDEEGGSVVRVSSNARLRDKAFRSPQNIYIRNGMDGIREDTLDKSQFLMELGINVNLAPVADVVTNTRAYMYDRAFGKGAEETAEYVRTTVTAMKEKGIGCVIKHFPGYGNTSGDTHNGAVVLDTAETVVFERDLLPFKAGIEAGADAVLVSHTITKAIDDSRPASMSDSVIAVLRGDLGFEGVVMSDALDMDAIKEYGGGEDVCVEAIQAGIDLLCTPEDPVQSFSAICNAVADGTLSEYEIDKAAERIVYWKLRMNVWSSDG
ncbi:MAG: hypothetical protein E7559_10660 [Ruminococcaceae bacterium]|nr:hypothetical protein [Oscillospiraceae bacterium]